jgi:hypothetical protein
MRDPLTNAWGEELAAADRLRTHGDPAGAFRHLERAHILGQRRTLLHVRAHWEMFKLGCVRRDPREVLGQLPRLLAALLMSRIWVPAGNTGGSNVSAFRRMPIPDDLARILKQE